MEMTTPRANLSIEKDGQTLFVSSKSTSFCSIIMAMAAHGKDLEGSTVSCDALDEPTARMMLMAKIKSVRAKKASNSAYNLLKNADISIGAEEIIDPNAAGITRESPLQRYSRAVGDTSELFQEVKWRIVSLLGMNVIPDDSNILTDVPHRIGVGGGGT